MRVLVYVGHDDAHIRVRVIPSEKAHLSAVGSGRLFPVKRLVHLQPAFLRKLDVGFIAGAGRGNDAPHKAIRNPSRGVSVNVANQNSALLIAVFVACLAPIDMRFDFLESPGENVQFTGGRWRHILGVNRGVFRVILL